MEQSKFPSFIFKYDMMSFTCKWKCHLLLSFKWAFLFYYFSFARQLLSSLFACRTQPSPARPSLYNCNVVYLYGKYYLHIMRLYLQNAFNSYLYSLHIHIYAYMYICCIQIWLGTDSKAFLSLFRIHIIQNRIKRVMMIQW